MRILTFLGLTMALIISMGFWSNHSLQESTRELSRQIEQVSHAIEEGEWENAREQTGNLEKIWLQKARWWPVFLDHQEMDNINFSLAKFKEYVASQNEALSKGQLSELKLMIEHIPQKEELNLKNIL
ncbi:MAG: DUF4363 family protein [Syntrophomonadaceae bacterium]|jgi:hypothetical protein|nr:DUF4363 family protein [Syntrophomonadaceae bacterium]